MYLSKILGSGQMYAKRVENMNVFLITLVTHLAKRLLILKHPTTFDQLA